MLYSEPLELGLNFGASVKSCKVVKPLAQSSTQSQRFDTTPSHSVSDQITLENNVETEDIRRTKSGSFLDVLRDYPLFDANGLKNPMAVADPLPPNFMASTPRHGQGWNTFSRFSQPTADSPKNKNHEPLFTLESLAAELAYLSSGATGDMMHLTQDYYTTSTTISYATRQSTSKTSEKPPPLKKKSLSFPKVKRDAPLRSCVHTEKVMRRTKSVRFADTQGLPLIEAIHQLRAEDSSYTENKIVPFDDDEDFQPVKLISCMDRLSKETYSLRDDKARAAVSKPNPPLPPPPPTSSSFASASPNPALKLTRQLSPPKRRIFRFTHPGYEPGFHERVAKEKVVLESARDEPSMVRGVIRVANISFHKEVTVRWTHDHWRTYHDTNAMYFANDGHTDRYTFELPVNGDAVQFAIRYKCEGSEYWDNNRGENYVVQ